MQKEVLLQLVEQNSSQCTGTFKNINNENINFRLTAKTASVGFIYRHIGEIMNTLGRFLGFETDAENTTLGQPDTGLNYDLADSHRLVEEGFAKLKGVINSTPDDDWLADIKVPMFGEISRMRLLSLVLFHNSHHCGQIASAIRKGMEH